MNVDAITYAETLVRRLVDSVPPSHDVEVENEWPSEATGRAVLVETIALLESTCEHDGHFARAVRKLDEDTSVYWPYKGELLRRLLESFIQYSRSGVRQTLDVFVSERRIAELGKVKSEHFDLGKLIQFCHELNTAYATHSFLATACLLRAIVDHVPPIFDAVDFAHVANNTPFPKSVKASIQNLERSMRNIADGILHRQISKKEVLPSARQVSFQPDMDVLLAQIIERLRT